MTYETVIYILAAVLGGIAFYLVFFGEKTKKK